jgi:hypothetical protein
VAAACSSSSGSATRNAGHEVEAGEALVDHDAVGRAAVVGDELGRVPGVALPDHPVLRQLGLHRAEDAVDGSLLGSDRGALGHRDGEDVRALVRPVAVGLDDLPLGLVAGWPGSEKSNVSRDVVVPAVAPPATSATSQNRATSPAVAQDEAARATMTTPVHAAPPGRRAAHATPTADPVHLLFGTPGWAEAGLGRVRP